MGHADDFKRVGGLIFDALFEGKLPEKITISREKVAEAAPTDDARDRCPRCSAPLTRIVTASGEEVEACSASCLSRRTR